MASGSGSGSASTPDAPPPGATRPPNFRNLAWKYGWLMPSSSGSSTINIYCTKCKRTITGGVNRFQYHLAGITQRDTTPCIATTEEIKREMMAAFAAAEEKKMEKARACAAIQAAIDGHDPPLDDQYEHIAGSLRGPRVRGSSTQSSVRQPSPTPTTSASGASIRTPHSFFVPRNTPGAQPSLEATGWNREVHEQADKAIANFWYFNNIAFNVASSPYWEQVVSALTVAGKGYKSPSRKDLSGRLLNDATQRAAMVVDEQKIEWEKYGCTILSDGWTDGRNRTILNFLVASIGGIVFLRSVDASNKVKNTETLADLLEDVVMEVGSQNVVQIITDNAAAYVAAGRVLEGRYPSLFWTPCAAHVLDLLLEDIGKLDWVAPIIDDARSITKFIYNHTWVLSLMRDHTQGKELVRAGATRFATNFLTLQSILDRLTALKQMFVSQPWLDSSYAKKVEGQRVATLVFDTTFAQHATDIVKVSEPLVRVLRLADGEENPMGYIYEAMDRAKEAIKNYYKGDSLKFDPIWEIIDRRWDKQLHQPLHAAGYLLNPGFFFSPTFSDPNGEVMHGFSQCVARMVPDMALSDTIFSELTFYREAKGILFSSPFAIRQRTTTSPEAWWKHWGGATPNLQKIALRILSQPCSASGCERNWSLFEAIHTKKRNKLAQKRLNDLVFVQYNLRLSTKKIEQKPDGPIDLDEIDPFSDWTVQEPVMQGQGQEPLFTEDEILGFEREAMEAGTSVGAEGGAATGLDDIAEEEGDDSETASEESVPMPSSSSRLPRIGASTRTPSQAYRRLAGKRKM